jgi:hypothetical protein
VAFSPLGMQIISLSSNAYSLKIYNKFISSKMNLTEAYDTATSALLLLLNPLKSAAIFINFL